MIRRLLALLVCLSVLIAACSAGETVATTTSATTSTTQPTTTTTRPPTTTTTVPTRVTDASDDLQAVVERFYTYAAGETNEAPRAPEPVVTGITGARSELSLKRKRDTPKNGRAFTATFKDKPIAVVAMRNDRFLAVKDDQGWKIVGGRWPSVKVPAFYGKGPRLVAVVGSDARPGEDVDRSRADSIHFVGLDGEGGGAVVGVPRDSYVPVPGHWTTKITGSLSLGGPETMMATFEDMTDLDFEGYVLTGFEGFENLLGVLGGVEVRVPFAINDRWAKVALDAGRQMLDGAEALGFARARKTVPNGDFTRSEHQGQLLVAATRTVRDMGMSALPWFLEKSEPHLITNMTPAQILTYSAMAISADMNALVQSNIVAPGSPGSAGSASVVYLHSSADDLWDDLADGRLDS